jgi:hypothetical protein
MKLKCCSGCRYGDARARRTPYGPGIWCAHPDNQDGVPQGVLDAESASVVCAFGEASSGGDREEAGRKPVVKVRRRVPVTATS